MNRFPGFLVPRPDWIKVLYLFGTLGLHRLLTKTLKLANEIVRRKMARFAPLTDQVGFRTVMFYFDKKIIDKIE